MYVNKAGRVWLDKVSGCGLLEQFAQAPDRAFLPFLKATTFKSNTTGFNKGGTSTFCQLEMWFTIKHSY